MYSSTRPSPKCKGICLTLSAANAQPNSNTICTLCDALPNSAVLESLQRLESAATAVTAAIPSLAVAEAESESEAAESVSLRAERNANRA